MSVDVSKIKSGDRVRISLYGLPESDWLVVTRTSESRHEDRVVLIETPDGSEVVVRAEEVAAHEPAAPALPEWWGVTA